MKLTYKAKARRILAGLYLLVVLSMCSYEKLTIDRGADEHSELLLSSFVRKADNMFYTLDLYAEALANEPKVAQCMVSCSPRSRASLEEKSQLMKQQLRPLLDKFFDLTFSSDDGFVKYIHFAIAGSKGTERSFLFDGVGWEDKKLNFNGDDEVGLITVRNRNIENIYVKRAVYLKGRYVGTVSFIAGNYLINNLEPLYMLRQGFLGAKYYVNDLPWYSKLAAPTPSFGLSDHVSANMSYAGLNLEIDVAYSYLSKYQSLLISLAIVSASFVLMLLLIENRFNGIEIGIKTKELGNLEQRRKINVLSHHLSKKDENEKKLEYKATHDLLTGVLNKTALLERLDREVLDARRYERDFALLFIDLDNFKHLNDYAGHQAGDYALSYLPKI
ncbi:diguanylate cyclase [Vibrio ishigakensis]|uniref:Diguanylate cyclase n=1 Tax=Vibrio ishigakensis TaxID=1481914 RepID=A0A0B8PT32_9VIBR|nr:diguanylate cyclase [Vibrio ishigakensis]